MKKLFLLCAISSLLLSFSGCSSGSSTGMQTVLAQTGYSNASLSGTYSVQMVSPYSNSGVGFYNGIGTIQFNGSGSITTGTLNVYFAGHTAPCVYGATGTYSLQSTALGTAALNLSTSTAGCAVTVTYQLSLAAANSGLGIQFASTDGNIIAGSAVNQ